jgi:apolipoprotein N-acyltransferase
MAIAMDSGARWWLGWITLLPLFYSIRVLKPAAAFTAGAFWGASLFAAVSLAGSAPFSGGFGSLLLISAVPGLYAGAGALLTRQVGFSPYLLALGWMGVELALSPLGLPHGLLVATQGDSPALQVVGSLTGYAVVAFLVAYLNAVVFCVLSEVPLHRGVLPRISACPAGAQRLVLAEVQLHTSYLIRQSHPRAPPVCVH